MIGWLEHDMNELGVYYLHYEEPRWEEYLKSWCSHEDHGRFMMPREVKMFGFNLKPGYCAKVEFSCKVVDTPREGKCEEPS